VPGNSVAPDQILYFDVTYGKYENFAEQIGSGTNNFDHPFRLGMEGRFTIPKIGVFLGFESNTQAHSSQGDLRFVFGTSFDVLCLLQKVGVGSGSAGCDTSLPGGNQQTSPTVGRAKTGGI